MSARARKRIYWAYLFIFPQFVFFIVFTIYPIIMSYVYSFFDWNGLGPLKDFVRFDNFKTLFRDTAFLKAFKNNFIYIGAQIVLVVPLSLLVALSLNLSLLRGKTFYRTIYFLPVVITTSIIGTIMKFIFGNDGALVNSVLQALGWITESIPFLSQPWTAMLILIVVGSWKVFGMIMVYWLAGIQSLPGDIYEAAKVDGAGTWSSFRYLTIPLLIPVGTVILLLTVVNGMHVFDLVKTLTGGGPYFATDMVDLYIYRYAFDAGTLPRIGYASAAGIVFGLTIFVITLILGQLVRTVNGRNST